MAPAEVTFIEIVPSEYTNQIPKLALSKARSHAASASYRKRRPKKDLRCRLPSSQEAVAHQSRKTSEDPDPRCSTEESNDEHATSKAMTTTGEVIPDSQLLFMPDLRYECFRGLRRDPFLCLPNDTNSGDLGLIDFFSNCISPINHAVGFVFNVTSIASGMLGILSRDKFYHALLSILQSMDDQLHELGSLPSFGVLQRKGKAIARIRKALEGSKETFEEDMLCAIVLLAVLEGSSQTLAARDVHRKTLSWITSQRGGLNTFDHGSVFRASVMQFDTFWTWESGKSMFPGQRQLHDPIYPSNPSSVTLIQDLPTGFRDMFLDGLLSYDILPVLSRATFFNSLSRSRRNAFLEGCRGQEKAFDDFWEACPCLDLNDSKYHPLERLLTMSVMYYIYGTFSPRAFPTGPGGPTPSLVTKLCTYRPATDTETGCLQWMMIVASDLSTVGDQTMPARSRLMVQLQKRYPEFQSLDAVLNLGPKFLWSQEMTRSVQSYWTNLATAD